MATPEQKAKNRRILDGLIGHPHVWLYYCGAMFIGAEITRSGHYDYEARISGTNGFASVTFNPGCRIEIATKEDVVQIWIS